MRMHEAMRLGAMLGPQVFGTMEKDGGTCARMAACKAEGIEWEGLFEFELWDSQSHACPVVPCKFGWLFELEVDGGKVQSRIPISETVVHLNDEHLWTREQIADWLEPIEEAFYAAREKAEKQEEAHALAR